MTGGHDRSDTALRVADLPTNRDTAFEILPDSDARAVVAEALGFDAVRKLRFAGTLAPEGRSNWRLTGRLGATIVQPCVVTLDPVTTRIDTDVERLYLADWPNDQLEAGGETEMPEDDTREPLPRIIELARVMEEALALAAPDYPRTDGVEHQEARFAEPGIAPMTDDDARPFAALKALRGALGDDSVE